MKLNPINPALHLLSRQGAEQPQFPNGTSIGDTFSNLLDSVNRQQIEAEAKQTELLTAQNKDIHGIMIALEKAEISMRMMLQVDATKPWFSPSRCTYGLSACSTCFVCSQLALGHYQGLYCLLGLFLCMTSGSTG